MSIFKKVFGKTTTTSSHQRILAVMQKFVEVSRFGMDPALLQSYENCQLYLTYMFGAVDMLCQVHDLDETKTLALFQELLENVLGGYTTEEAKQVLHATVRVSEIEEGQRFMIEGGEAVRNWISGAALAPHRLQELLT